MGHQIGYGEDSMATPPERGRRASHWESILADELVDAGCDTFALVPDKRLEPIVVRLRAREMLVRTLTQEEECVAYAAGQLLAGGRPAVLMQCSGLGNAVNAIASFVLPYGLGIPMVISMRGTIGERNPAQVPMGRAVSSILGALGIQAFTASAPEQVAFIARSIVGMAGPGVTTAMLLGQELEAHTQLEDLR
jgi:sulfopyruvate decarboxylase alpha subunit